MALATITARVDECDKSAFDEFCSSVGLNTSTAINLYIKAVLRERRIPVRGNGLPGLILRFRKAAQSRPCSLH